MCFSPRRIPKHLIMEPNHKPGFLERHWVKLIGSATLVLLGLALSELSHANATENLEPRSASESQTPNAATTGNLLFKTEHGYQQATHLESEAVVNISGLVARWVLTQHFKNESDQWQEAVYTFPLQEKSAVNRMEMHLGERKIVARIREKIAAKKAYEHALQQGKKAALTEQQRPNLFTQHIANIAPGETISIELHVTQPVDYHQGQFNWRLPMTLTPRYVPGNSPSHFESDTDSNTAAEKGIEGEATRSANPARWGTLNTNAFGWAQATNAVPDAPLVTPFYHPQSAQKQDRSGRMINPMKLTINLEAGLPLARVAASYHDIHIVKDGPVHHIATQTPQIPMDRDFELTWQPVSGQAPEAALFTEQVAGENFALLMLVPTASNAVPQTAQALPRDITFIIDTSGSMSGPSIIQAKDSLLAALARLNRQDRFNIIEFNSTFSALYTQPTPASRDQIDRATQFVNALSASGGTEMLPALQAALAQPSQEGWLKQMVFITDGSVANESALFTLIHQKLGDARLFTVGIGSAPNSFFMRKAAQFGRGTFTHIGSTAEVGEKMLALFSKLESAVLTNLHINFPPGVNAEMWPAQLPDIYRDEPLLVAIKYTGTFAQRALSITGDTANAHWQRTLSTPSEVPTANLTTDDSSAQPTPAKGIATLWAREKIEALLDEKVRGTPEPAVRAAVLEVALKHELMSPYTSLLAIDETPTDQRPLDQPLTRQPVTPVLPNGQTASAMMYPRTATPAPMYRAIALGLMLSLLLLNGLPRRYAGFAEQLFTLTRKAL